MAKKEIIDKILKVLGLDIKEFAMQCDIVPNTLFMSISRDSLSDESIKKIHEKFNVRKQYLKTGKGEIFEENTSYTPSMFSKHMVDLMSKAHESEKATLTKSYESEKSTLIKSIDLLEKLNSKYVYAVQLLEDQTKSLEDERRTLQKRIAELEGEKKEFEKQISELQMRKSEKSTSG